MAYEDIMTTYHKVWGNLVEFQASQLQKTKRVGRLGKGENCSTEGYLYMKIIVESTSCAPVISCFTEHLDQLE